MRVLPKLLPRWPGPRRPLPSRPSTLLVPLEVSAPSPTGRVVGLFTLPVAVQWGQVDLPAGDYMFVAAAAPTRAWVYVRHDEDGVVFFASSIQMGPRPARSVLCLGFDSGGYSVHALMLRDLSRTLRFDAPPHAPHPPAPYPSGPPPRPGVVYILLRPLAAGPGDSSAAVPL